MSRVFKDIEKSRALDLLEDEGIWAAVAASGASHTTIYRWHAAHVRTLKKTPDEIAIEEDEERILGARLRRRMLLTAMAHVDRSDAAASSLDGLRWMTAAGIAFDKLNKVGGASPHIVLTEDLLESEISRLEVELGKVAPSNARVWAKADQSDIDQSLGQAIAELERRIRSDVTKELTNRDALGRPIDPQTVGRGRLHYDRPNGHNPSEGAL